MSVGSGQQQMQTDLNLLSAHQRGEIRGAVRFYRWQPAAISLGYHQRHWPEHWCQCRYQGHPLAVVRRPSGGGAVLHQGDLCFTLVTGITAGGYRLQYQRLQAWLIQGWQALGVPLYPGEQPARRGQAHCFAAATPADLVTATGHKFIGSAQLRRGHSVLHQGSMQLQPDPELWVQVFGTPPPPPVPSPNWSTVVAHLTHLATVYFG
ncbi:MAG: biotin/lipoate A/B protein ligase family protein [Gloeomargarita sp. DG_2_bins_126]